jgi:glycosyltransferase involved in cell wall biosynthesis
MKVLVVTSKYHPYYQGGGEYSVKRLVDALSKTKGMEVTVLTASNENCTDVVEGVEVRRIKHRNIYWSYDSKSKNSVKRFLWHLIETSNFRMRKVAQIVRDEIKPDVVHFRNIEDFSPIIFYYLKKYKIPTIQTLNSYTMIEPKGTLYRESWVGKLSLRFWKCIFSLKKLYSKDLNAVVGVSQFTLDFHIKLGYFPKSVQSVIRTGINKRIETVNILKSEKVTFGYIGSIIPSKGVKEMISNFVKTEHQNCELIIAGTGESGYEKECITAAEKYSDRVSFIGKVNQSEFFSKVNMVIIPSLWNEPFPRVLMEAYEYNVPVLSSANGGTKELIINHETGIVYNDWEEFKLAINSILTNPNQLIEFSKHIINNKAEYLNSDIDLYLKLYRNIIKN